MLSMHNYATKVAHLESEGWLELLSNFVELSVPSHNTYIYIPWEISDLRLPNFHVVECRASILHFLFLF